MPDLSKWSPPDFALLAFISFAALGLLAFLLAIFIYNLRSLAHSTALQRERQNADLALKRELIQRGLPPQDMEQAIKLLRLDQPATSSSVSQETSDTCGTDYRRGRDGATSSSVSQETSDYSDEQLEANFITRFTQLENVTPEAVEQAGALVRAVERSRKEAAVKILTDLARYETESDIVLAAIRSLCTPVEPPREAADLNRHVMPRG